jgi:hypothetical protein
LLARRPRINKQGRRTSRRLEAAHHRCQSSATWRDLVVAAWPHQTPPYQHPSQTVSQRDKSNPREIPESHTYNQHMKRARKKQRYRQNLCAQFERISATNDPAVPRACCNILCHFSNELQPLFDNEN